MNLWDSTWVIMPRTVYGRSKVEKTEQLKHSKNNVNIATTALS
jgi:hypothetical protein